jgi:hypothetical protein
MNELVGDHASKQERDAVVKWLERKAKTMREQLSAYGKTGNYMEAAILDLTVEALQYVREAIERGEHLESK